MMMPARLRGFVCSQQWCTLARIITTHIWLHMTTQRKLPFILGGVAVLLVAMAVAWIYFNPTPEPTVTLPGITYSVKDSDIGALLDFDEAKQVLEHHLPGFTSLRQLPVARPLTLPDIQPYYPDLITDEKLANINADFEALAKSRAGL